MKLELELHKTLVYTLITLIICTLSSCSVVGGVFRAGMWSGIMLVVIVVGGIIYFLAKGLGGSGK